MQLHLASAILRVFIEGAVILYCIIDPYGCNLGGSLRTAHYKVVHNLGIEAAVGFGGLVSSMVLT